MVDPVRIEAHPFHLGARPTIVLSVDRVIQQKLGPVSRWVDFDWQHRRRADQDSIFAFFSDDEGTLFNSQASAEFRRQHDRATTTDFAGQSLH